MVFYSVKEILSCIGGRVVNSDALGPAVETIRVNRPVSLKGAQSTEIAFFFSRAFEQELPFSNPGILVIGEPFAKPLEAAKLPFWSTAAVIACQDPYFSMALITEKFLSSVRPLGNPLAKESASEEPAIHPTAVIHSSVLLGTGVRVGAYTVVEAHAQIGAGCVLYPGCFVGSGSILGEDCVLFPRVVIYDGIKIGSRVRLHSGAVIGADGFGYAPIKREKQVVGHQKIHHLGTVSIGDDVEIGANSALDRATFGETSIGKNAKLDNLVQIGHNASVDEGGVLCGGVCLAGNSSVGKYAYVAGMTGLCNHVHVGDGATVAAHTLVSKEVPHGGTAVGNPQREYQEHFRVHALLNRLLLERRKKNE